MSEPRPHSPRRTLQRELQEDSRFQVFGLNLLVKMLPDSEDPRGIQCPKGQPIRYGVVLCRGDGYDSHANAFRQMPKIGAAVAFEETLETVEGHFFYIADDEYRVIHLDALIISFPPES